MEQLLDEKSFLDKYNFDNYVHVTVVNPGTKDHEFIMVVQTGIDRTSGKPREEHRTFKVVAGGKERFVGSVANLYLDQMSKKIAQEEGKFSSIADWNARAKYYDDLIISVDDPYSAFVPYDDADGSHPKEQETAVEQPFAGVVAPDAEKERLAREVEELKARLAQVDAVKTTTTDDFAGANLIDSVMDAKPSDLEQPFAGVAASTVPKHAGGRPRKIQE